MERSTYGIVDVAHGDDVLARLEDRVHVRHAHAAEADHGDVQRAARRAVAEAAEHVARHDHRGHRERGGGGGAVAHEGAAGDRRWIRRSWLGILMGADPEIGRRGTVAAMARRRIEPLGRAHRPAFWWPDASPATGTRYPLLGWPFVARLDRARHEPAAEPVDAGHRRDRLAARRRRTATRSTSPGAAPASRSTRLNSSVRVARVELRARASPPRCRRRAARRAVRPSTASISTPAGSPIPRPTPAVAHRGGGDLRGAIRVAGVDHACAVAAHAAASACRARRYCWCATQTTTTSAVASASARSRWKWPASPERSRCWSAALTCGSCIAHARAARR